MLLTCREYRFNSSVNFYSVNLPIIFLQVNIFLQKKLAWTSKMKHLNEESIHNVLSIEWKSSHKM